MHLRHQFAVISVNQHPVLLIQCHKVNKSSAVLLHFPVHFLLCNDTEMRRIHNCCHQGAASEHEQSGNESNAQRSVQSFLFSTSVVLLSFFLSSCDGIGRIVSFFLS